MTDIALTPIVLWEMEFTFAGDALGYDSRYPANLSGTTNTVLHGTGFAEAVVSVISAPGTSGYFLRIIGDFVNGYPSGGVPQFFKAFTAQVGSGAITTVTPATGGVVNCSWMGQDIFRDTDGTHHRIGYGDVTICGVTFTMPAAWEMPLPIVETTERGFQGTLSITKMGPAGAQMDMRCKSLFLPGHATITGGSFTDPGTSTLTLPGLSYVASADGKSITVSGLPGPLRNRFGTIDFGPLTCTPQSYQSGSTSSVYLSSNSDAGLIWSVAYATTSLSLTAKALRYPDGAAIVGMPASLGIVCHNGPSGALQTITYPNTTGVMAAVPSYTDASGNAAFTLFYDYAQNISGFVDGTKFGGYTGFSIFAAEYSVAAAANGESGSGPSHVRALGWLYDHLLDSRTNQPFVSGTTEYIGPGFQSRDVRGQIVLQTTPQIAVTRLTSYAVDAGASTSAWAGIGVPVPSSGIPSGYTADDVTQGADPSTYNATQGATVTVTSAGGGTQFTFPAVASGFEYGVMRDLSSDAGRRRSFRNFRWMKVKIAASVSASIRVILQTKNGYSAAWTLALAAGDNIIDLDMIRGDKYPFSRPSPPPGRDLTRSRGVIPAWNRDDPTHQSEYDEAGEWLLRSYTSAPDTAWNNNNIWYIRLDQATAGVTYTIKEITLHDRTDGDRTPLRVLAAPMGNGGSTTLIETPTMQQAMGVTVNGRRVLSAPLYVPSASFTPGTFAQLLARWADAFDGGSGIWTATGLAADATPLTAMGPPTSVTSAGFTLSSRLTAPYFLFLPGFDKTVTSSLDVVFELGQQVDGVVINDSSRAALSGKTLAATYQRPAAALPTTWSSATTDDDGYFEFAGFPHPWTNPSSGSNAHVPVTITAAEDALATWAMQGGPALSNGNEFSYIVLSKNARRHRLINFAERRGPFHLISPILVGGAGLAYWRSDTGAPRASGWDAAAVTVTTNADDDNPALTMDHRGRLLCLFERVDAGIHETHSDDDGQTWSTPTMTITGGQYPCIRTGADGSVYRVAYIPDSGADTGTLQGQWQAPGDPSPSAAVTLKDAAGSPIPVQEGMYSIDHLSETASRWILTVLAPGATTPREWVSADDAGGTFVIIP